MEEYLVHSYCNVSLIICIELLPDVKLYDLTFQKNLAMDELFEWKHISGPNPCLSEVVGSLIYYTGLLVVSMWNICSSK